MESGLGLGADGIAHVEAEIIKIVAATNEATEDGARVLLVLDGLDFLLAATGCAALQILEVVGALREVWPPSYSDRLSRQSLIGR